MFKTFIQDWIYTNKARRARDGMLPLRLGLRTFGSCLSQKEMRCTSLRKKGSTRLMLKLKVDLRFMLKKKEYTHLMLKFYVNTRLKLKVECHRTPSMVESRNRQQIRRAASLLSFHSACAWEQIIRRVLSSFLIRVCLRTTIQCMHPEMEGRPDVPNEFFADARGWSRTTDKTCRILQTNLFANTHGDGRTTGRCCTRKWV